MNKKEFIRFLLKWVVPIIVFFISLVLSILIPYPFYFNSDGTYNFIALLLILVLLPVFIYISIKIVKSWWKWLRVNNIIK